jgi:ribosome recycling factor
MTQENRQQMVKVVGQKIEDCFVSVRQTRHEAFHKLEQAEKDKSISKDDLERSKKQIDELVAKQKADVEQLSKAKEQEILTV